MTSTGRARRTSVRFINIVIGAQKSVCHTQKSYVFPSAVGSPSLPLSPSPACSSAPSCATITTHHRHHPHYPCSPLCRVSHFLFSLSAPFLPRCPAFAAPFLFFVPPADASYLRSPPLFSCSALFRAVEIVCPYGRRAAIRRAGSNEKGGVNGISRGRHGHRCRR